MNAEARAQLEHKIRALCLLKDFDEATRIALSGYGPELLGWLVGVLRDEVLAEDIFQQFSVSFWRSLPGFRWESSLRVWAYCIARRILYRYQQDRERHHEQLGGSWLSKIAQEISSINGVLYRQQAANRLVALRQELPEEMQTLLILRIDREMSFAEIGQVLEIEPENARQRFKRAKDKLREMAERDGLLS